MAHKECGGGSHAKTTLNNLGSNKIGTSIKCKNEWLLDDWGYYCRDCSIKSLSVICLECFDQAKHINHCTEAIYCEKGLRCDCGNPNQMKSEGFCDQHSTSTNKHKSIPGNQKEENSSKGNLKYTEKQLREDLHKLNRIPNDAYIVKIIGKYFGNGIVSSNISIKNIYSPYNKYYQPKMNECLNSNKKFLLWYGLSNVQLFKILNNKFEIEKINGKLGNGYYFSDRVEDCIQLCDQKNGFLILCEVAVGQMFRYSKFKIFTSPPKEHHSIKLVGKYTPNANDVEIYNNDVIIPIGATVKNSKVQYSEFDYNKYVVFEKIRHQIRFIVEFVS